MGPYCLGPPGQMATKMAVLTEKSYRKTIYQKSHIAKHPIYQQPHCKQKEDSSVGADGVLAGSGKVDETRQRRTETAERDRVC